MAPLQKKDEVADFSGFFGNDKSTSSASPMSEVEKRPLLTKKAKIFIIVFILLVIAQVVTYLYFQKPPPPTIPAGYRVVTPEGQPSHIEPIPKK